jgi:hypothetical protein
MNLSKAELFHPQINGIATVALSGIAQTSNGSTADTSVAWPSLSDCFGFLKTFTAIVTHHTCFAEPIFS